MTLDATPSTWQRSMVATSASSISSYVEMCYQLSVAMTMIEPRFTMPACSASTQPMRSSWLRLYWISTPWPRAYTISKVARRYSWRDDMEHPLRSHSLWSYAAHRLVQPHADHQCARQYEYLRKTKFLRLEMNLSHRDVLATQKVLVATCTSCRTKLNMECQPLHLDNASFIGGK